MTQSQKQPSLIEICIQFLCKNAQFFAQTEKQELELTKQFVMNQHQEHQKRIAQNDSFGLEVIPSKPSQEFIHELSRRQRLSFPLLLQLSSTSFTSLNLCMNGRVRNEWMILLREMKLTHMNLSHCLLSNEGFFYWRKKAPCSSKKRKNSISSNNSPQEFHKNSPRRYKEQESPVATSPHSPQNPFLKTRQYYPLTEHLVSLNVSYIHVMSIDGITCIAKECRQLKTLSLEGCKLVNNKCLEVLANKLPSMTALNLKGCIKISNHGLKALAPMKCLEYLNVSECSKISAEGLSYLGKYNRNLMNLNLRQTRIESIANLEYLQCLRTLDMHSLAIKSLKSIENVVSLTSLNISEIPLPDSEIQRLGNLFMLKCLNMCNNKAVSASCLTEVIKNLPELNYLDVSRTFVNDSVMKQLATKKMIKLNISSCTDITDQGFSYLCCMQTLDELQVRQLDTISAEAWQNLFETGPPNLRAMDISDNFFETDSEEHNVRMHKSLMHIVKLKSLTTLYLCHCDLLDDKVMKEICQLSHLTTLDLSATAITCHGLDYIANLANLQNLVMRNMFNMKSGFGKIGACTNLEFLDLSSCKVTNDDLKQMSNLKHLIKLSLMNCKCLTSSGVKQLQAMTDLQNLNLYGVTMTDNGISYLRKLEYLNKLRITDSKLVTDVGFDMIHDLPNLVYLKQKQLVVQN